MPFPQFPHGVNLMPDTDDHFDIRLKMPFDAATATTKFYRILMEELPAGLKNGLENPDSLSGELVLADRRQLRQVLVSLRRTVKREIRWLKSEYRTCLVKSGVDPTRKLYLKRRIEELEGSSTGTDEMISLQNNIIALEQYELRFENLKSRVNFLIECMEDLVRIEENPDALKDTAGTARELENIIMDLLPVVAEGECMVCVDS